MTQGQDSDTKPCALFSVPQCWYESTRTEVDGACVGYIIKVVLNCFFPSSFGGGGGTGSRSAIGSFSTKIGSEKSCR